MPQWASTVTWREARGAHTHVHVTRRGAATARVEATRVEMPHVETTCAGAQRAIMAATRVASGMAASGD